MKSASAGAPCRPSLQSHESALITLQKCTGPLIWAKDSMIPATLWKATAPRICCVVNPIAGWRKEVSNEEGEFPRARMERTLLSPQSSTSPRALIKARSTPPLLSHILEEV